MSEDLFRLIPPIRRARGYRLYDRQGRRYLDLWQGGGAAILGHRSAGTVREMKEALSRGLVTGLPTDLHKRLVRVLARMFPDHARCVLHSCLPDALEAVSVILGRPMGRSDVRDPAVCGPASAQPAAFWRPFLPPEAAVAAGVLIPILPVGWDTGVVPVCSVSHGAPPSPRAVSPVALAGTLRALADLGAAGAFDGRLSASLAHADQWRLTGPYLAFTAAADEYPPVFTAFLRAGVLLSPDPLTPSILPQEVSEGELRLLLRLFRADTGG